MTLPDGYKERNGFGSKLLSKIKEVAYIAMNGYTHGGVHQITRRIKELSIEPNYAPEDIIEALKISGTLALIALYQIAQIANDDRLMADITMKLNG